jgi:hypothetical protein
MTQAASPGTSRLPNRSHMLSHLYAGRRQTAKVPVPIPTEICTLRCDLTPAVPFGRDSVDSSAAKRRPDLPKPRASFPGRLARASL